MRSIMAEFQRRPRHQIIHHERDLGVWTSVNRGLALSRSRYVLVLTSDVLVGPRLIEKLVRFQQMTKLAYFGPDVAIGMRQIGNLFVDRDVYRPAPRYNGACWLMDRVRLEQEIGLYDPQFYVCFGDVDYVERLGIAAHEQGDATLIPAVMEGLYCCHLDKQTRRAEMTAQEDTDMELKDGRRFREKWKDRPDIVNRHRELSHQGYIAFKTQDLGGWEAARIAES